MTLRALVIDDARTIRTLVGRMLGDLGYEVHEAADGQQGLEALARAGPVDLVMVDWNMPVMDGLEFVRRVRTERAWDAMRILMVTTETDMENVQQALEAGADEYVMKPFTLEVIREKLTVAGLGPG